jgi:endonuclease G
LVDYFNSLSDPAPPPTTAALEFGIAEAPAAAPPQPSPPTPETIKKRLEESQEGRRSRPATRGAAPRGPEEPPLTTRAIVAKVDVVEKAQKKQDLSLRERIELEKIIDELQRPVLNVVNGKMSTPPAGWEFLEEYRPLIEGMLPSIGRIDVPGLPDVVFAGTGFVVGDGLLLTNRHVAEFFVDGVGEGADFLSFQAGPEAIMDPQYEVGDPEPGSGRDRYKVKDAVFVHPHWDAALLRVEPVGHARLPAPLQLASQPPPFFGSGAQINVVVVGYPYIERENVAAQMRIFGGIFGRKRIAPGYMKKLASITSAFGTVMAATHDATTLGGNSGSAVIDLTNGTVVGLHFAGVSRKANYAVPTWELARDKHVTDADVVFAGAINGGRRPSWLKKWNDLTRPAAPEPNG